MSIDVPGADAPHRPGIDDGGDAGPRPITVDAEARPVIVRSRRRRELLAETSLVLALPAILFYALQVEPYFRQNGLDPYMYLGYAQEPGDLINRYGLTYYSVRFGLLWPVELTTKTLGVTGGYFTLRYLLALLAGASVYLLVRRRAPWQLAAAAMTLCLASPVLLRALMTSYSDTTGVPYLTGAACALLLATGARRRWLVVAWSGVLFGLAVHSNPFLVAVGGCMVLAWSVTELRERRWRLVGDWALLGLGVAVVTLVGVVVYWFRFDQPNILRPSIEAATSLSGENGEAFRSKTGLWLSYQLQLYVPLLVLVAWAATLWRRRPSRTEVAAMLMLGLVTAFFVAHQFVARSTTLETYYYSSYLWPVVAIGLAMLLVVVFDRCGTGATVRRAAGAVAVVVLALPVLRNVAFRDLAMTRWPWVPLAFVVVVATTVVSARRGAVGAAVAVSVLAASSYAFMLCGPRQPAPGSLFHPAYDAAIGGQDWSGLDTYKLTYDLMGFTPDLEQRDGNLMFWYDSTTYPWVGSVHGAFLAFTSSIASGSPLGMPFLDDWRINHLRDEDTRRLELLGTTPQEIDAGTEALRARGLVIEASRDAELRSGPYVLYVRLLTLAR